MFLVAVAAATAAFLAAHATKRAAEATQRAAEATQRAAEAGLLAGFLKDYAANEMVGALRTPRTWHEQEGADSFAANWKSRLARGDAESLAVDRARRLVTSYFHDVDRIHRAGLISLNTMQAAVDRTGLGVLFHVVENLERELSPEVDLSFIDGIRAALLRESRTATDFATTRDRMASPPYRGIGQVKPHRTPSR